MQEDEGPKSLAVDVRPGVPLRGAMLTQAGKSVPEDGLFVLTRWPGDRICRWIAVMPVISFKTSFPLVLCYACVFGLSHTHDVVTYQPEVHTPVAVGQVPIRKAIREGHSGAPFPNCHLAQLSFVN